MISLHDIGALGTLIHVALFVAIALRVIMLRPEPGVALAWLLLVAVLPGFGLLLYLMFGERRVGQRRARRMAALRGDLALFERQLVKQHMTVDDWSDHPPQAESLDRLCRRLTGIPTLGGNTLTLHHDTQEMLESIAADIDAATKSIVMEFYIWHAGGTADHVLEALLRAAERGVHCRVLVDSLGAGRWWRSDQPGRLRRAGVELQRALPTGIVRGLFSRNDLRLHRKIVTVDGRIAWTGSMNLVDPRYFKQDAGVGEWVDAMVRIEGHAVLALGAVALADWQVETGEKILDLLRSAHLHETTPRGEADIQVLPSGPSESGDSILQMILALTYMAREELILTTPYFVPDQAMLRALRGAAARGAEVHLVVPAKNDSVFVRYASQSYYDELMDVGVLIHPFEGGLLHTKSITVDGQVSMIGTVNLDMRSLWLNHEITCFVYDRAFTKQLRALQQTYLDDSAPIDPLVWAARPRHHRFVENAFRLASPLL